MRRRTWIIIAIVVIAAAVGGYFAWTLRTQRVLRAQQAQGRQVTVRRGTLVATVSASGSIAPQAQVMLNFQTPGTVDTVSVVVGQKVKAGEALAQLNTAEFELAAQQARQAWIIQQVNYSLTVAGPKPFDLAAAQAQLTGAWAQYNDVKTPQDNQISQALAQLKKAQNDLQQAEDAYDGVVHGRAVAKEYGVKGGGLGKYEEQMRAQVEVLRAAQDAAQTAYDRAVRGATDAQLRTAWAAVQQAQANLDRLTPDADRIAISRAQLEQARIAYEQAKLQLDRATLTVRRRSGTGQRHARRFLGHAAGRGHVGRSLTLSH
jgi:multidrug efflux pump subunit AcrA (membrane-fusion protein)